MGQFDLKNECPSSVSPLVAKEIQKISLYHQAHFPQKKERAKTEEKVVALFNKTKQNTYATTTFLSIFWQVELLSAINYAILYVSQIFLLGFYMFRCYIMNSGYQSFIRVLEINQSTSAIQTSKVSYRYQTLQVKKKQERGHLDLCLRVVAH